MKKLGWVFVAGLGAIAANAVLSSSTPGMASETFHPQSQPVPIAAETTAPASLPSVWRQATSDEEQQAWSYVLNSPLGITALNQLAIEGFISPDCKKTFYTHQEYGGFQTLLQVKCATQRGVSIAHSYDEMRVTFNRFEDSIENFSIERIYTED